MLNTPLHILWVDYEAPPANYGHPGDFLSYFSTVEKKDFSKVICRRMFDDWESEKFYLFLNMHAEARNEKIRFVACTKDYLEASPYSGPLPVSLLPQGTSDDPFFVLTLSKLFQASGYNPYTDSYKNVIEASPDDLSL